MGEFVKVSLCAPDCRAEALRILHGGLAADQQAALVHALNAIGDKGDSIFEGLFVASETDRMVGAAWAQLSAGSTAVIWPPGSTPSSAKLLMQAVANFLDQHQIGLAQLLVTDEAVVDEASLQAGGFHRLARLSYLSLDCQGSPDKQPHTDLQFVAKAADSPARFGELLLSTYVGSQDCPQLNGVRSASEILEGYREQGTFASERWFFVQREQQDVGALILTLHEDTGNWELVYMGLVPEARGNGLGRQVLDFAAWQARQGGAQRLVLAVDQENRPALDTYERAGFKAWDHRTVYARLRNRDYTGR